MVCIYNVLFLALLSAITWPGAILGLANIIDNPWSVCCRRSAQVGKQLAEVLLAREQGQRPVTLVGFSIGARVIYYCLRVRSLLKHVCTHCMVCFNSFFNLQIYEPKLLFCFVLTLSKLSQR